MGAWGIRIWCTTILLVLAFIALSNCERMESGLAVLSDSAYHISLSTRIQAWKSFNGIFFIELGI